MTIKLDVSQSATHCSIVVTCSHCPHWRAFAFGREEGWTSGARHDDRVHPANRQASDTLSKIRNKR